MAERFTLMPVSSRSVRLSVRQLTACSGSSSSVKWCNSGVTSHNAPLHGRVAAVFAALQRGLCSRTFAAAVSGAVGDGLPAAPPQLSRLQKSDDIQRLLFPQLNNTDDSIKDAADIPNAPVNPAEFVEALEMVVRTSGQEVNPEQLDDIFDEMVSTQLLQQFTPAQIASACKNLSIMCASVRGDILYELVEQVQQQMTEFSAKQLSNVVWGLMHLVPMTDADCRELLGIDEQWLDKYCVAVQQQLHIVMHNPVSTQHHQQPATPTQPSQQQQQQQQKQPPWPDRQLPSALQVANLLLIPAAAGHALPSSLLQVLEEVLVLRQHSLCAFAVAQLFTCYVQLEMTPGPSLLQALLDHLSEDWMLYDYDELTQVAYNASMLQLELPNTLLADITQRASVLQDAGLAGEEDIPVLEEALQRLSARKAVAAQDTQ